jgi:hypothetical protein
MTSLAIILVLNAFLIAGFHMACWEGMIFGRIQHLNLPAWIAKPLYDCCTCMASVHSTYVYAMLVYYCAFPLWGWFLYVPTLAGISTLVWKLIDSEDDNEPWIGAN